MATQDGKSRFNCRSTSPLHWAYFTSGQLGEPRPNYARDLCSYINLFHRVYLKTGRWSIGIQFGINIMQSYSMNCNWIQIYMISTVFNLIHSNLTQIAFIVIFCIGHYIGHNAHRKAKNFLSTTQTVLLALFVARVLMISTLMSVCFHADFACTKLGLVAAPCSDGLWKWSTKILPCHPCAAIKTIESFGGRYVIWCTMYGVWDCWIRMIFHFWDLCRSSKSRCF